MSRYHRHRGGRGGYSKYLFFLITIVLAIGLAGMLIWNDNLDKIKQAELQSVAESFKAQEQENKQVEIAAKEKEILHIADVLARIPGIVCWGDSLTAGVGGGETTYPGVLQSLMKNEGYYIPVINEGVGGENTKEIMARAGAIDILADAFTIPSDTFAAQVKFSGADGSTLNLLRQMSGTMNCSIAGVEGVISIDKESSIGENYRYYFTRMEAGNIVKVIKNTQIINESASLYTDYIPIIFMGQNGGWSTPTELIEQQEAIIKTLGINRNKYLILGLTSGSAKTRAELEKTMVNHWGDKYINLRGYLSSDGVYDVGLEPTKMDLIQMKQGIVPDIIRVDDVHLNASGYTAIAKIVYEKLLELDYLER